MKTLPPIGTRVTYRRKATAHLTARTCTGTVVAHYKGGDKHTDEETGEEWTTPDHAAIQVDSPLPEWWPYLGTDRFAPPIAEIHPFNA